MNYETLQFTAADGSQQEVALQNLSSNGTARVQLIPRTHAPSEFRISLAQPPETAVIIPFKSQCVVWACRQSPTGANNSFSAGQKLFQGRCWELPGSADNRRVNTEILLFDALRDLEEMTFQSVIANIESGSIYAPVLGYTQTPDVVLFQYNPLGQRQADGTFAPYDPAVYLGFITTWQQIVDIVNYAANFAAGNEGVNIQVAAAPEFQPQYRNTYPVRSMSCLQALVTCLQSHPGVYTEIDYSTTPPTLHFRDRAHMTALTLPYKSTDDQGRVHIASDIQPLYHLRPDRVAITYKINGTLNGQPVIRPDADIYPVAGGPFLLTKNYSCDISGASESMTVKNFISNNFSPFNLDLWRLKVPALRAVASGGQIPNDGGAGALALVDANLYDPATHPRGIQVVDEAGVAIDFIDTFTFWTDQSVYAWFQLTDAPAMAVKATIKAHFAYTKNGGNGRAPTVVADHEHSFRILLTNAPSNLYVLKQTLNTGEAIPNNLAQYIYTELHDLQWKVGHEIIQAGADANTVPTLVKPGLHTINLAGGAAAWTTMNAVPETVTVDLFRTAERRDGSGNIITPSVLLARHRISCGPVNHLEPAQLLQLYNMFTKRNMRKIDTNQALNGLLSSSQTDLSATDARENSVAAVPDIQSDGAVAPITLPW